MNVTQERFIQAVPAGDADHYLVETTGYAMSERLAEKRSEGKIGWHTKDCDDSDLEYMLQRAKDENRWIDVANLAAMLYVRTQLYPEDYALPASLVPTPASSDTFDDDIPF